MQKSILLSAIKKAVKDRRVRITDHADEEMAKDKRTLTKLRRQYQKGWLLNLTLMINLFQVAWFMEDTKESIYMQFVHIPKRIK